MRITAAQRNEIENRVHAAMDRLLRGQLPPGRNCGIKTLAGESVIDRTAFYGNRPYAHLREEFETRLAAIRQAGNHPDPHEAHLRRTANNPQVLRLPTPLPEPGHTAGQSLLP